MKYKIGVRKPVFFLITISSCALFSSYFYDNLTSDAMGVLVNIFSILAGFLIGIIALVGEPSLMLSGSWRVAEASRDNLMRRLIGLKYLLFSYLLALALIFSYELLDVDTTIKILKSMPYGDRLLSYAHKGRIAVKFCILTVSLIAFVYSFTLPSKLVEVQKKRIDEEIERRRKDAGIDD